ncbi:MAG: hypothetical protein KGZ85_11135, partial [Ignavibacterium sp.]|nr:hypothetical protein [Ignavibacterium sp.]
PWGPYITEPINTLSPNGVIFIDKGNVTMRGTVHGQVTVATSKKGGNGMGNVYIDSDIVYKDDPRTNPNSEDMLGIVCEDKIEVTFDNSRGDINIHATMFAQHDGLNIESYSSYTKINNMNILGGLIAKDTKPTASYSGGKPTKGYRFIHKFDDRFLKTVPPYFPTTGGLEIVSWLE